MAAKDKPERTSVFGRLKFSDLGLSVHFVCQSKLCVLIEADLEGTQARTHTRRGSCVRAGEHRHRHCPF